MKDCIVSSWIILILAGFCMQCNPAYKLRNHTEFPDPVDTKDLPIEFQVKKEYKTDAGIFADNLFDGARMNNFYQVNDTTFRAVVSPENYPINHSAYFAFRIWSQEEMDINLEIEYTKHLHRYWPKLSMDGEQWIRLDSLNFDTLKAPNLATLKLKVGPKKLWVCAQELYNTEKINAWAEERAKHPDATFKFVGKSKLGRDMMHLNISTGPSNAKDIIVLFGRLHPPEVPGYLALEAFVETVLNDTELSKDFRKKYSVLVYPCVNPDGVDLGHWRHNAGGIDINRDWSHYRQAEPRLVAGHVIRTAKKNKSKVVLGLDFHSTQSDLYYSLTKNRKSNIYNFKDYWMEGIDQAFADYTPNDQPYDLNQPITKGWFYLQFNAESITYEIGDETPREFVREKARVAAQEMMKLLILRN